MPTITIAPAMLHARILCLTLISAVTMPFFASATPAQESQALFLQKCASCHAKDGSGHTAAATRMAIPDLRSKRFRDLSDAELADSIGNGTKHYAYPHAFLYKGFTSDQIAGIVKYIRTLQSDTKSPEKKLQPSPTQEQPGRRRLSIFSQGIAAKRPLSAGF